ncbi:MAG TPA: hypothetical protein PKH10_12600 [bacterium]|nr:hypothetical protein [bacterium]
MLQPIRPGVALPTETIADRPLDLPALFPGLVRFECEIGFCSAIFLNEYANRHPDTGILGIEKKRSYFLRGLHNLERKLKQDNVRIINFDAHPVFLMLVPPATLDALHIYFPDPWPKKRHLRNRLVNRDNLRMFHDRLRPGGRIYLATDHPDYAAFIERELTAVAELFTRRPYGTADREVLTKWERKQIENGTHVNYYLLEKR